MELTLKSKKIGKNGFSELRKQIDKFVADNWETLYEGAIRLGFHIEKDYYAPERIQINNTRLHAGIGLKYADGHKYSDDEHITKEQLKKTVKDIQTLIDEAAKNIPAPFKLEIRKV